MKAEKERIQRVRIALFICIISVAYNMYRLAAYIEHEKLSQTMINMVASDSRAISIGKSDRKKTIYLDETSRLRKWLIEWVSEEWKKKKKWMSKSI